MPGSHFSVIGFHEDRLLSFQFLPWLLILFYYRDSWRTVYVHQWTTSSHRQKPLYSHAHNSVCHHQVPTKNTCWMKARITSSPAYSLCPWVFLGLLQMMKCHVATKHKACALNLDFHRCRELPYEGRILYFLRNLARMRFVSTCYPIKEKDK